MNIGKFSVTNSVLINIMMAAIMVLGLVSFFRLPQQVMSNISFNWVLVAYGYPGASAEEVEKSVTVEVEKEISDVDHISAIKSTVRDGSTYMFVEFEDDLSEKEFARVFQDLRAEIDKVQLPDDVTDPHIQDFSTTEFMSILTVNLIDELGDPAAMHRAATTLRDKLLDVDDIAKVEIYGAKRKEVWIEVDRRRLEAFGLSLDHVANAVKYRNMNVPGGTLEMGNRAYLIETRGEAATPEDFKRIVVRSTPGGGSVSVGDLGTINDGYADPLYDARFNGTACVSLWLTRTEKGNVIRVVEEAKQIVNEFQETLPAGIRVALSNDNTYFIRDTLGTLGRNALMGFGMLIIVLLVFIGLRNSMITALGIPITFAITFMFMEWYGESLNGSSLFALVLVLGMIVDHAIVIIENSYRHRQLGLSPADAAIAGTNEVVKPVIAATMTTLAAFLPLMLLPGIMGKFMRIVPIVVSLALVASTLEALVFLPVHFAEWGGKAKEKGTGWIGRFQGAFRALVARIFKRRWLALGITLLVIIVSAVVTRFVKEDLFAEEDWTMFYIDIELPKGTPRSGTDEIVRRFEERLLPHIGKGEIVSVTSSVGLMQTDDDWIEQDNVGQLSVDVAERKEGRARPILEIMEEFKKLCADIPGAEDVRFRMVNTGPPVDKPVQFRLAGDNFDDMSSIAADFRRLLEEYPSLYNIDDNFDPGGPELRLDVNEQRASELGLSVGQIGLYVRNCFEGVEATTYYDEDDAVDVIVKLAERDRGTVDDLLQMKFPTPDGRLVPFSTVCSLERGTGMAIIKRTDRKREVTVSADAQEGAPIQEISKRVEEEFAARYRPLYPDITLEMGGQWQEFKVVFIDILRLFWIGLFLIYVILGAQFKSFLQPFIIMFTIPFAFVGCVMFLFFSGTPVSITVLFAGVALAGISVNDSIVLISFINGLRRTGADVAEAVAEGAAVRLRPIILTSVTTIGGLLPMAIGLGGMSATWSPMASTIIFGLFFSTVGTLIVIPCAYGALDDITAKFSRRARE
ncbi:MAG: AcrB/AcrD/AcrF family protein [Chitinivibrionales bacterium]|nr:AcrB/AcrD/AcrF family protein [Chitinivibrionales bacterium]MBD3394624.1 AcrB/AcrD/AcrF family protein [Chitinivibrionales bacterium]